MEAIVQFELEPLAGDPRQSRLHSLSGAMGPVIQGSYLVGQFRCDTGKYLILAFESQNIDSTLYAHIIAPGLRLADSLELMPGPKGSGYSSLHISASDAISFCFNSFPMNLRVVDPPKRFLKLAFKEVRRLSSSLAPHFLELSMSKD
jgi:hypothetical protein